MFKIRRNLLKILKCHRTPTFHNSAYVPKAPKGLLSQLVQH